MSLPTYEYENTRRLNYGGWQFVPVCPICRCWVKADATISLHPERGPGDEPNATCKRCGRVQMIFEGCYEPEGAECE